jgi:hypothetical protein
VEPRTGLEEQRRHLVLAGLQVACDCRGVALGPVMVEEARVRVLRRQRHEQHRLLQFWRLGATAIVSSDGQRCLRQHGLMVMSCCRRCLG